METQNVDRGVAYSWALLVAADGNLEEQELVTVFNINSNLKLTALDNESLVEIMKETINDISTKGLDHCYEIVKQCLEKEPNEKKMHLLISFIKIALADDDFGNEEMVTIFKLADVIDISKQDILSVCLILLKEK
ncbi:MAG: hypothetical protein GF401_08125 [Chitinivibrionales bacterium]|nr:hypothetical protein [Chitinivibrionales bacterium]